MDRHPAEAPSQSGLLDSVPECKVINRNRAQSIRLNKRGSLEVSEGCVSDSIVFEEWLFQYIERDRTCSAKDCLEVGRGLGGNPFDSCVRSCTKNWRTFTPDRIPDTTKVAAHFRHLSIAATSRRVRLRTRLCDVGKAPNLRWAD